MKSEKKLFSLTTSDHLGKRLLVNRHRLGASLTFFYIYVPHLAASTSKITKSHCQPPIFAMLFFPLKNTKVPIGTSKTNLRPLSPLIHLQNQQKLFFTPFFTTFPSFPQNPHTHRHTHTDTHTQTQTHTHRHTHTHTHTDTHTDTQTETERINFI